ncbi:MAG: hypothetical protein M1833_004834 [Piccolia ochrophora]|nr:MAG: hypothetical protein M1833_004834 [Piccolia ochrophora]
MLLAQAYHLCAIRGHLYRRVHSVTSATTHQIRATHTGSTRLRRPRQCTEQGRCFTVRPYSVSLSDSSDRISSGDGAIERPRFTYGLAAAFAAKGTRFDPQADVFNFEATNDRATPSRMVEEARSDSVRKRFNSGQDAFFICGVGNGREVAFGVADGVGGWAESGIDPADFSHGLCEHMEKCAVDFPQKEDSETLRARNLMEAGYQTLLHGKSVSGGGSTACVAVAGDTGTLEVAKHVSHLRHALGDSGFVQLRSNAVHHFSDPQTHAFNTPFQLSIVPPKILAQSLVFGGQPLSDLPKDANLTRHRVRHGDVLVFASDGVWDNLSAQDVLRIVARQMTSCRAWEASSRGVTVGKEMGRLINQLDSWRVGRHTLQGTLASSIAGEAKSASMNSKVDGPFAREVQKFFPDEDYHGGKVDDICVIVAVAVESDATTAG